MATYYYANVRRYQDESSTILAEYLVKNTKITETKHNTNTKYYVYYLIDVYASSISTFSAWKTALTNDVSGLAGKGILVSPTASINVGNGLAAGLTINVTAAANTSASQTAFVTQGAIVNDNSHQKVSFSRKAGATSGQVIATPTVTLQWKSSASPNWTLISSNSINWGTTDNVVPSISWTTVVTPPIFPIVAIQDWFKAAPQYLETPVRQKNTILAANQITILDNYVWDKCDPGLWHFVINFKTPQYGGRGNQEHWTCTKNGDSIQSKGTPSTDILADKKKLAAWTKKNVTDPMIFAKSNGACTDNSSSGNGLKDIATVAPPKGDVRWNPPPHLDARGDSHAERLKYPKDHVFKTALAAFADGERGRIYQDINSADILNKDPDKLKELISSKGSTNQWGFRFMYNPTSFGYQSSSNNSVDWTLGSSDPATLLSGNSTVTFEVYINRIPDLKYLRLKTPQPPEDQVYLRTLTDPERQGILNRGTEYDIEFLYRVLNGDPLKDSLLFNTSYKGFTSDFGYTTGVPCWLVLNENLRYYGSVASFSVNHLMFDLNMVPMLSIVNITFLRYPALWNEKTAFGDNVSVAATKEYLKTTGKAP